MMRMVQPGLGEVRDLVIVYHIDPSATSIQGRIKSAAGANAIVVNETGPAFSSHYAAPMRIGAVSTWALRESGAMAVGRLVLVGYSEGCQALRAHLLAGARPDAVVAVDGTHASRPPVETVQLRPWRAYADRAKAEGSAAFVASHTAIVPPTYLSTRETLELVTGWSLDAHEGRRQEGRCVVYSYPGADAEAHRAQAREALPRMLAEVMSMLGSRTAVSPPPAPATGGRALPTHLEAAVLEQARATLAAGVCEEAPNRGPWIDEALRACGVEPPANWCAATVTRWLRQGAAAVGLQAPVAGSAGAKRLVAQLATAGLWTPAVELRRRPEVVPGSVIAWHRGAPGAWTGHIGVVESWDGGDVIVTVEGNSGAAGDRVARMTRRLQDPLLLGVGRLGGPAAAEGIDGATAARLLALSDAVWRGGDVVLPEAEPIA